jgi:DNA repair and recombination RAD54-like protein
LLFLQFSDLAERRIHGEVVRLTGEPDITKDKGVYVGVEEDEVDTGIEDDGLGDIWKEMSFALESSKVYIYIYILEICIKI